LLISPDPATRAHPQGEVERHFRSRRGAASQSRSFHLFEEFHVGDDLRLITPFRFFLPSAITTLPPQGKLPLLNSYPLCSGALNPKGCATRRRQFLGPARGRGFRVWFPLAVRPYSVEPTRSRPQFGALGIS